MMLLTVGGKLHVPYPAGVRELSGYDSGYIVLWEFADCNALSVLQKSIFVEVEIKVVEAVLPAFGQKVGPVGRSDVEEESGCGVARVALLCDVYQACLVEVDVEVGADYGISCWDTKDGLIESGSERASP